MATFSSRWTRSRFSARRRYGRYGSSSKRRAYGNYKAATQQRDSTNVVINKVVPVSITFPTGESLGGITLNVWQQLATSSFYANYAPMYDQLKLTGVRVKINGSIQGTNVNAYLTPTITTAWDRNGLTNDQFAGVISTYSSAISKPWSLGNAFIQTRSIFAQTMSEKSQYLATTSLSRASTDPESPTNPTPIAAIPFKPQLLIQIALPVGSALGGQTMSFNCELDMMVKFRGLRKGAQPTNAPSGTIVPPISVTAIQQATGAEPLNIPTSSFIKVTADTNVSVPSGSSLFVLNPVDQILSYWGNGTGSVVSRQVQANQSYVISNVNNPLYWVVTSTGQRLPAVRYLPLTGGGFYLQYDLPPNWSYN